MHDEPPKHRRHWLGPEGEGGDDAEIAATAAQVPRTGRILSALAVINVTSAATSSNDMTLSQLRPYLRTSQPTPPLSVRPATPVFDTTPTGTASP